MTSGKPITWNFPLLEKLYCQQRLTVSVIAIRFGVSAAAVNRALKLHGIRRPKAKDSE